MQQEKTQIQVVIWKWNTVESESTSSVVLLLGGDATRDEKDKAGAKVRRHGSTPLAWFFDQNGKKGKSTEGIRCATSSHCIGRSSYSLQHFDVPNDLLGPGISLKGNDEKMLPQILQHSVFKVVRQFLVIDTIANRWIWKAWQSGGTPYKRRGNRWWERCQVSYCATSNPPTLGYLWAAYRPPSREESRVEAHGPTKGSTLGGENFATVAISKSTLKPKMSIGPYSLARVLQVGWWTLGVPQWLHCVRERIPKAPNAHCLIRDLGKSWKLERPGRCQLRWTPGRATWQRLGFNNRSSKAGKTSTSSIYIGSNACCNV